MAYDKKKLFKASEHATYLKKKVMEIKEKNTIL